MRPDSLWGTGAANGFRSNERNRARRAATIFGFALAFGLVSLASPGTASAQSLGPNNLALYKYARQSSTYAGGYYGGDAYAAVDGNLDGTFYNYSVTHTEYEAHPWWEVDLGESRQIGRIELANRTDCCGERLSNFMVIAADIGIIDSDITDADTDMYPGIMRTIVTNSGQARIVVPINRTARFVRIALVNPDYLSLAEVQVFEADNAARGRYASQTSTTAGGEASHAVDGNTSGAFASGSVSVTKKQTSPIPTAPVWTVDLGLQHDIRDIDIWSSNTDCCDIANPRPQLNVYVSTTQILAPLDSMKVGTISQGAPARIAVDRPGRFVAISLLGSSGPLSLAEVQVWAMARGSVGAHITSAYRDPTLGNITEGDSINLSRASSFHNSSAGDQPYWDADLGSRRYLETVKVWPTPGDSSLSTFHVFASDTDFVNGSGARLTTLQEVLAKPNASHWIGRGVEPVTAISVMRPARFVRVQLDGYNQINFTEAEIVTTEGIATAMLQGSTSIQRNNGSIEKSGNEFTATGTAEQVPAINKKLQITGYFPRPNTTINAYHVVPFMSGFAAYNFASAVSGTTPVLTSYSAAPMYQFTVDNAQMPAGWLRGSVTQLFFSADDNYGFTPTPLRGINDNGSEQVYWPDNRLVSASTTPNDYILKDANSEVGTQPSNAPYLELPAHDDPIKGYPSALIPSTVSGFKSTYGITPAASIHAGYYNAGDLGLGRDMYCRSPSGFKVCLVDNIARLSGGKPIFGDEYAVTHGQGGVVATVVMVQPTGQFYVAPVFGAYDANGNRLDNIALDATGKHKAIPNNCMTCHGGSGMGVDAQFKPYVKKAYFLPFDQTAFLDRGSFTLGSQQEQFRQLNEFVKGTAPPLGMSTIINGWYQNKVNTVNQPFDGSFVPPLWKQTPGGARVYSDVIAPYCRTCHVSQEPASGGIDFLRASDSENLRALLLANVCNVHKMPHAQQTLIRFWKSGARAQLLGHYGRNDFTATCDR